jgi:hypothetical protein
LNVDEIDTAITTIPIHNLKEQKIKKHGGDRARTDDLLRAKQLLSQLSYAP